MAVSEAHNVCIYDVRAGSDAPHSVAARFASAHGSCVQALAAAPSPAGCALLACAGSERALTVYDCRTNRPLRRQNGVMRKEVLSLAFSTVDARWIYASGADNEIVCRRWDVVAHGERPAAEDEEPLSVGGAANAMGAATADGAKKLWACRGDARWLGLAVGPQHQGDSAVRGDIMAAWSASGCVAAAHVAGHG